MKDILIAIEQLKQKAECEETKKVLEHLECIVKNEQAQLKSVLEKYI